MASLRSPAAPSALAICVAGALSLAVAMGIGRFAFTPMLPLMIRDGQLDLAAGGWMAAANYAGYLVGGVTASRIGWSAARLALVALLLTTLLTAAMALPGSAWLWLALRLAAGLCSAWAFVATSAWSLAALAWLNRSAWSGAVYAGVGAGIGLAGLCCLQGDASGASAAAMWLRLGLLALVLMLPVAAVLRGLNVEAAASKPRHATVRVAPPPGTTGLVVCYGMLGFGYILPATFLPVLARSVVQDPALFGLAWPLFGLTAALSTFMAGWCLRHASRLAVWAISNLVMGIGTLLPSLWLSGLTIALSALLVGGTFMVVTMAGLQEIRSRAADDPMTLLGRMTSAFAIGQIAGPSFTALLLHLPLISAHGLNLALQAGAVSLLLSAAWLWREARYPLVGKTISHTH